MDINLKLLSSIDKVEMIKRAVSAVPEALSVHVEGIEVAAYGKGLYDDIFDEAGNSDQHKGFVS